MNPAHVAVVISIALFVGILVCLEVGYRVGLRGNAKHPESAHEGIGVIEAAVFALLGLLLGFSFAGGTSRLESKRQLIVQDPCLIIRCKGLDRPLRFVRMPAHEPAKP